MITIEKTRARRGGGLRYYTSSFRCCCPSRYRTCVPGSPMEETGLTGRNAGGSLVHFSLRSPSKASNSMRVGGLAALRAAVKPLINFSLAPLTKTTRTPATPCCLYPQLQGIPLPP